MWAGADSEDLILLMRNIDLQSCFRIFAVADTDNWKKMVYALGGYRANVRVEMGKMHSAHHGQRLDQKAAPDFNKAVPRVL